MKYICNFSCGAASAIATHLMLKNHPDDEILILNAIVTEEHPDNTRFLHDCEKWFNHPITRIINKKYWGSAHNVFKKTRFIKNRFGARCSRELKRDQLAKYYNPGDVHVLGLTNNETKRFDRIIDANNDIEYLAPLIEHNLTKQDCLTILQRANIELPIMYRMGYANANCIGCVKGGQGYWNRIRKDFPEVFEQMCQIEETIGPTSTLFYNRKTGERIFLRNLDPNAGRFKADQPGECGYFCELAEQTIGDTNARNQD